MSVMVGIGRGAKAGILIRDAGALQIMAQIDTVVVDKTGTLTEGKPTVTTLQNSSNRSDEELLQLAASLEIASEHPLGHAIVVKAQEKKIPLLPVSNFKAISGKGVTGTIGGQLILIGNQKLLSDHQITPPLQTQEETVLYLAVESQVVGLFTIADPIKSSAQEAIDTLHKEGIRVILVTGDNAPAARRVGLKLNIDEIQADVLPEEKNQVIQQLQAQGRLVAMAGDGINDAPALSTANVGIAMGTGTDIAIESARVTLVKGDLRGIVRARHLSLATMSNIRLNLLLAFFYNGLAIPIAAGALYPAWGLLLNPMIASAAMALSSVSVILNALRLRKTVL